LGTDLYYYFCLSSPTVFNVLYVSILEVLTVELSSWVYGAADNCRISLGEKSWLRIFLELALCS
jgi:hypothetical protein